jgi:hypothetical protein
MNAGTAAQWIVLAGAVVAALGTVWRYCVRPILAYATRVELVMSTVEKEWKPNGGASAKDALDRIETSQVEALTRLSNVEDRLSNVEELVTAPPKKTRGTA